MKCFVNFLTKIITFVLTKRYKSKFANHYEAYNIFLGIVFEIMKFQKFWQKEKDSIIRYWMIQNERCLELILVDFRSVPSLKNPTCTKIFREHNNSNRRENIGNRIRNEFIPQNYADLNRNGMRVSLKPFNSRLHEKLWKYRSGLQETNVICLFQVQERYDTLSPVLFHAEWRVKGGKSRQIYCLEMNGYTMVDLADSRKNVRVNRVSFTLD